MIELGEIAYRAYAASDGRPMPLWSELPPRIRAAWADAGRAIAKSVYEAVEAAEEACPETLPAPPGYPGVGS